MNAKKSQKRKPNGNKSKRTINQRKVRNPMLPQIPSKTSVKAHLDIPYARCRLDPFHSGPSMGLPDVSAAGKLVFDHRGTTDFTVKGSVDILILPSTPYGACIKPNGSQVDTLNIAGTNINQGANFNSVNNWVPICPMTELFVSDMAPSALSNHPIGCKIRHVGVAFRLTCTSSAFTANGIIEIDDSEMTAGTKEINATPVSIYDYSYGNPTTFPINSIDVRQMGFPTSERIQTTTYTTAQLTPKSVIQGVSKHVGAYNWDTIHDSGIVLTTNPIDRSLFSYGNLLVTTGHFGTVWSYDDSFLLKRIRITGENVSYRLETMHCVEYLPSPGAIRRLPSTRSNNVDIESIAYVDKAVSSSPTAFTQSDNASYLRRFIGAISKFALPIGSLFGPEGMAAGGIVSTVSNYLQKVL